MSYEVRFEGAALLQLRGLPSVGFDALVERVVDLVREPWDADVMTPGGIRLTGRSYSVTGSGCCRSGWMTQRS